MLAPKDELDNVIESILFVAGQGVELDVIAEKLEVDVKDVKKSIERLKEKHKDEGINVITYKNCAQLSSCPSYAEDIANVLNPIREKQLTKAALETAAIIAYKQPVTRLDIEQIRGVNSDYALQVLLNFKLIEVVGRKDAIGKPLLFGTTDEFLKRFELQSINDLPDYEELLERIEVLHQEFDEGLYRSTQIIPEEELPDSDSGPVLEKNNEEQSGIIGADIKQEPHVLENATSDEILDNNKEDNSPITDPQDDDSFDVLGSKDGGWL